MSAGCSSTLRQVQPTDDVDQTDRCRKKLTSCYKCRYSAITFVLIGSDQFNIDVCVHCKALRFERSQSGQVTQRGERRRVERPLHGVVAQLQPRQQLAAAAERRDVNRRYQISRQVSAIKLPSAANFV